MGEVLLVAPTDIAAPLDDLTDFEEQFEQDTASGRFKFAIGPYDPLTFLPYPIAPPPEVPERKSRDTSLHHANFPESELKSYGVLGEAIIKSRVQVALDIDHNLGRHSYHELVEATYVPPLYEDRIFMLAAALAGAVADKVFVPLAAEVRDITAAERERLHTSGELKIQSAGHVPEVMANFVVRQGMRWLSRKDARDYIYAEDVEEREEIVDIALQRMLPVAFMPMRDQYYEIRDKGYLPAGAPTRIDRVARKYVFRERNRAELFDRAFWPVMNQRHGRTQAREMYRKFAEAA